MNEIYDMYPFERDTILPVGAETTGIFEGREV